MADILTRQSKKSTGTDNITDGSVPTMSAVIDVINYTCVWQVNMSAEKNVFST